MLVLAEATVGSATVALKEASVLGVSIADKVPCSVSSALWKVPKADTWASAAFSPLVIADCGPSPKAVVSSETMADTLSPEPMPVDVIAALPLDTDEAVDAAEVAAEEVVLDMLELMSADLVCAPSHWRLLPYPKDIGVLRQDLSKRRTKRHCHCQAWLFTISPVMPTLRARAGNSSTENWPTTAPFAGLICCIKLLAVGSKRN